MLIFWNDFMILCVLCDHVYFSKNWNLSAEQLEYYFTHLITKKLSPKKVWSMNDEAEILEGKWLCRYIISDSLLSLFMKNLCYGNPFLPRKCGQLCSPPANGGCCVYVYPGSHRVSSFIIVNSFLSVKLFAIDCMLVQVCLK